MTDAARKANTQPLYHHLATAIDAHARCEDSGNTEWEQRWERSIEQLIDLLPHGSGIDSDWQLSELSDGERIILTNSFHNMDEHGGYCGWSDFKVTVKASLIHGIDVRVTGASRDTREYLTDILSDAFRTVYVHELANEETRETRYALVNNEAA